MVAFPPSVAAPLPSYGQHTIWGDYGAAPSFVLGQFWGTAQLCFGAALGHCPASFWGSLGQVPSFNLGVPMGIFGRLPKDVGRSGFARC